MTRSTTSKLTASAKDTAEQVAETVKANASVKAEAAKETIADTVADQAHRFREASRAFDSNELASDAVKYLGDNLAYAASAVRDVDLANVQQDVTQFARRNPLVFFGGAAALGFLAARALKASERASAPDASGYAPTPAAPMADQHQDTVRGWGYS